MKNLVAGAIAVGMAGLAGALGNGVAAAETAYNVGGAKVPAVPWYEYTAKAGSEYYPNATRVIVDYPAGVMQGRLLEDVLPPDLLYATGLSSPTVGESVVVGQENLDAAIRSTTDGPAVAVGLSEGALVLSAEQARLAHDPTAPPPDQLSFAMFGDPAGRHAFGQSGVTALFPAGTFLPVIEYTVPEPVESQYDTIVVSAAYDGVADFPDRTSNLVSVLNAIVGSGFVHTPVAFTGPERVPPRNIKTTTNSRGATTTTYLVPNKHLPLTLPLRLLGVPDETVDQMDDVLQPIVDAGYSRNDDAASAPISVDPVSGLDPLEVLDPQTRADIEADIEGFVNEIGGLLPPGIA